MITQEEGGIAGLAGHFKSSKEWIQVPPLCLPRGVPPSCPFSSSSLASSILSLIPSFPPYLPPSIPLSPPPSLSPLPPLPLSSPSLPPTLTQPSLLHPSPFLPSLFPQGKHSGVRPWAEFLNVRKISKPKSSGEAVSRVLGNLARFQSNYLFVFLGLVVYCM